MKWSATVTSLIAGVISLVVAQDAGVYFTNPILGTVLTAGTPISITWVVTNTTVPTIDSLELRNGDAGNLTPIQTIFDTPYQMSFTKYDWMIPSNLTTDTSYVLVASNSAGVSYSAYFTIVGLPPGVTASDIATSTAPATIATAAASSASSASASSSASAVSQSAAVSTAAVSTAAASSAAASSSAASSVAAASSTPSTSITLKQAVATSGSNHLKAGVMGIAGAAAVAALLA